ncbi:MAG TPA: tetratricopeptide repeat protein [Burkholderiales bacterium]
MRRKVIVLLAALLTATAGPAFPEPPKSREAALAALRNPDPAARAEAINWIANRGTMADAALLQERLRDDSPFVRSFAESGLWLLWSRSGDAEIDQLMAHGVEEMQAGRNERAVADFTAVIRKRPDFAEGWNKRATVLFLAGEFQRSIADCTEVLKRNPGHFGALAGLGQIYLALDEPEQALAWFRKALKANPNLLGVEISIQQLEEALKEKRRRST